MTKREMSDKKATVLWCDTVYALGALWPPLFIVTRIQIGLQYGIPYIVKKGLYMENEK